MSLIDNVLQPYARVEAKVYLADKEIPQLMEVRKFTYFCENSPYTLKLRKVYQ